MQQDAAARPYKGGEDILAAWGDSDEPDAVRPTLKSSEEAPEVGGGVRDRRGPGPRTGPAAGRRWSKHGRGDAACDCSGSRRHGLGAST